MYLANSCKKRLMWFACKSVCWEKVNRPLTEILLPNQARPKRSHALTRVRVSQTVQKMDDKVFAAGLMVD